MEIWGPCASVPSTCLLVEPGTVLAESLPVQQEPGPGGAGEGEQFRDPGQPGRASLLPRAILEEHGFYFLAVW